MKRQGGFTLIELVVVIVILGILAVTAAPRFLNLQDDARNSALEGLKGAIAGAAGITYGKAAIAGTESKETATMKIDGSATDLNLVYGYPKATKADLELVVDGLKDDWKQITVNGQTNAVTFGYDGYTDKCVTYTQATSSAAATVKTVTTCK
ncbi:type II secretion system protein [Vibrio parahaemolyticus]|uniref:type II secretion system protein n=2 Tax=Vibrio parahaemolyticus TaxID=670 RepID=UPI00038E3474|nr:type II secretion system protein [Vibrio parahaemolyticus]EJG0875186.1 type II secretion system protein [Vibrio parahaemolyticus O3]EJG0903814.1 type II secretion system protein [Vibrio parahaemolyticus O3:K56]EJG1076038.1 type II secretion system protein [Vibrio parahaemolyticus O1:K56]ANQ55021.1 MSHA biogenesis protein MshA [Vibrio parahaemolyticus]ASO14848.1 MSHA biogenesis protein MshA [Vibrio parahaemolyticus]